MSGAFLALLLFGLLGSLPAHAAAKMPDTCSAPCSGSGWINWNRTGHSVVWGAHAYLTFSDDSTVSNGWYNREVLMKDSNGYYITAGYMLSGTTSACGNGSYAYFFWWQDYRPNGGGIATHCFPFTTYAPNAVFGDTFEIGFYAPNGGTSANLVLGDTTRNQFACNGGGGTCQGTSEATDFEFVTIEEDITNWSNTDWLHTTVWSPVNYYNGTTWQELSNTNSTYSGNNPPWIGYVSGQPNQFYSCSKIGSTNPC